VNSWRFT